ncbi:MAG: HAD family hydrolase [Sphingobium sp.]
MKAASRAELFAAAEGAAAVLCDWDGCLAIDNRLQPGVADFLRQARRIAIISNNSTMNRDACRRRLATEGVHVPPENIHLAGQALLTHAMARFADRPVHLLANPLMCRHARSIGLNLVEDGADAVLVLRDPRFDYARLTCAAHEIRNGARFWIANPDLQHPSQGRAVPETGALSCAISAVAGRGPDRVIGKPGPLLFEEALASLQLDPGEVIMIGDNPATDIAGATAANIRSMLVSEETWHQRPGQRPLRY